jgi:pimeloyl-ACP methyl ester carboxylesterase
LVLGVPALYAPERAANQNAAPTPGVWRLVEAALGSDALFWAASRLAPDAMTRLVLATDPALLRSAAPSERARAREVLANILPVSRRRAGLSMDGATAGTPPPYDFASVRCPVLAISVRDDLYGTAPVAAYAAAQVPNGRLVLYPTGGHLWVGHDAEMWAEIDAFARRLPSPAPAPASLRAAP